MTSKELKRRGLMGHATAEDALRQAETLGNVAFQTADGRFLTCTRSHVFDRLNDGQAITVLADYEPD